MKLFDAPFASGVAPTTFPLGDAWRLGVLRERFEDDRAVLFVYSRTGLVASLSGVWKDIATNSTQFPGGRTPDGAAYFLLWRGKGNQFAAIDQWRDPATNLQHPRITWYRVDPPDIVIEGTTTLTNLPVRVVVTPGSYHSWYSGLRLFTTTESRDGVVLCDGKVVGGKVGFVVLPWGGDASDWHQFEQAPIAMPSEIIKAYGETGVTSPGTSTVAAPLGPNIAFDQDSRGGVWGKNMAVASYAHLYLPDTVGTVATEDNSQYDGVHAEVDFRFYDDHYEHGRPRYAVWPKRKLSVTGRPRVLEAGATNGGVKDLFVSSVPWLDTRIYLSNIFNWFVDGAVIQFDFGARNGLTPSAAMHNIGRSSWGGETLNVSWFFWTTQAGPSEAPAAITTTMNNEERYVDDVSQFTNHQGMILPSMEPAPPMVGLLSHFAWDGEVRYLRHHGRSVHLERPQSVGAATTTRAVLL